MSVTLSTCQEICNSPLNNSPSKQLYSFPKSKRLDDLPKTNCPQPCYDLPPVKSTRAAGFGFGSKYDFTKHVNRSPAPNAYDVRGSLSHDDKKRGFSFGLSREAMGLFGPLYVGNKKGPGPGTYEAETANHPNISYSFRIKTNLDIGAKSKLVPGPGNYKPLESINKDGKYFLSKFKSSGATKIAPPSKDRFLDLNTNRRNELPGPGSYQQFEGTVNSNGSYFVSKYMSSLPPTFGSSVRKSASTTILSVPGPGTYRLPSEFGHYESSKIQKTLEQQYQSIIR